MVRKLRTAADVIRLGGIKYASVFATRRCVAALTPIARVLGRSLSGTLERALSQLVDLASRPLEICRERFGTSSNIEFLLGDGRSIPLDSQSLDAIWSYDVFVHVNPRDARFYFSEFQRVLHSGGHAVVHHPDGRWWRDRTQQHRSDLTDSMVLEFAEENHLQVVFQTSALVNDGDKLTVLRKP